MLNISTFHHKVSMKNESIQTRKGQYSKIQQQFPSKTAKLELSIHKAESRNIQELNNETKQTPNSHSRWIQIQEQVKEKIDGRNHQRDLTLLINGRDCSLRLSRPNTTIRSKTAITNNANQNPNGILLFGGGLRKGASLRLISSFNAAKPITIYKKSKKTVQTHLDLNRENTNLSLRHWFHDGRTGIGAQIWSRKDRNLQNLNQRTKIQVLLIA